MIKRPTNTLLTENANHNADDGYMLAQVALYVTMYQNINFDTTLIVCAIYAYCP